MNLAVIGSGGREHAICYKLKQSPKLKKLICIPGNAGTKKIAENIKEDILDFEAVYQIIKEHNIDLVVIGPEQPLVEGLTDYLNNKNIRVFGPSKFASKLEGSKAFVEMARQSTNCEVLHQDFLSMELPEDHFNGIFSNKVRLKICKIV